MNTKYKNTMKSKFFKNNVRHPFWRGLGKVASGCVLAMTMLLWPVAVAAQSLTVCTSTSYTVPSAEGVSGATYKWLENGAEIPGADGESYTNLAGKVTAGSYVYVRMAETESCGWSNSNAFIVWVTGSVAAPVISKPADGCEGGDYVFTVPEVGGALYEWTGGGVANGNSYTYTNAAAGALTVTVRTVTAACTSAPSGATVTAYARPSFTADPTPAEQDMCPGTATLSVTADNATAYQWMKNGTATQEGSGYNSATYTTVTLTNATYSVVASNGLSACSATSNDAEITILTEGCYDSVTDCPGFTYISNVTSEGSMTWETATSFCNSKEGYGWRLPTFDELKCICSKKSQLVSGYESYWYWSSIDNGNGDGKFVVYFDACNTTSQYHRYLYNVKCVK
jgi:hypothetical protein